MPRAPAAPVGQLALLGDRCFGLAAGFVRQWDCGADGWASDPIAERPTPGGRHLTAWRGGVLVVGSDEAWTWDGGDAPLRAVPRPPAPPGVALLPDPADEAALWYALRGGQRVVRLRLGGDGHEPGRLEVADVQELGSVLLAPPAVLSGGRLLVETSRGLERRVLVPPPSAAPSGDDASSAPSDGAGPVPSIGELRPLRPPLGEPPLRLLPTHRVDLVWVVEERAVRLQQIAPTYHEWARVAAPGPIVEAASGGPVLLAVVRESAGEGWVLRPWWVDAVTRRGAAVSISFEPAADDVARWPVAIAVDPAGARAALWADGEPLVLCP